MLVASIRLGGLLALLYALTTVHCAGPPYEQWEHLISSASTSRPLSSFFSTETNPSQVSSIAAPSIDMDESWADLFMRHGSADHMTNPVDPSTEAAYDDLEHDLDTLRNQQEAAQIGSNVHVQESGAVRQLLSEVQKHHRAAVVQTGKGGRRRITAELFLPFTQELSHGELESYTNTLTRLHPKSGMWPFQVGEKRFLLHRFQRMPRHLNELHNLARLDPHRIVFGAWQQIGAEVHDSKTYQYIGAFETPYRVLTRKHMDTILQPTVHQIKSAQVLSPFTARFKLAKLQEPKSASETWALSGSRDNSPNTQDMESIDSHGQPVSDPTTLDRLPEFTNVSPSTSKQSSRTPIYERPIPLGAMKLESRDSAATAEPPSYYPLPTLPRRLTKKEKVALLDEAVEKLNVAHIDRMMGRLPFIGPYLTPHLAREAFAYPRKRFWVLSDTLVIVRQDPTSKTAYAATDGRMKSSTEPRRRLFLWQRSQVPRPGGYLYQLVGMIDSPTISEAVVRPLQSYKGALKNNHYLASSDAIYHQTVVSKRRG